jgi:hypothetical protein
MAWKETKPMEERLQFVRDALSDRFKMRELCARDGVSRRIDNEARAERNTDAHEGLSGRIAGCTFAR